MIAAFKSNPKSAWLRMAQAGAILFSLVVVLFFLRHSLLTTAESFRQDFERQSFIEMSRGETFLVARKLAALSKGEQINCVSASKKGTVFFEERKGECAPGFFRSLQTVREANQELEISFTIRLQDELFNGFLLFLALQAILAIFTFISQRQAVLAEHRRDLDLANLARQVGHDIRSPLAVLSHFHEHGEADPSVAKRSVRRLSDLVNHLLGQSPGLPLVRSSLGALITEVVQEKSLEFGPKAEIRFFVEDSVEGVRPPGDSFMWRRLFSNILNNSMEAAEAGLAVIEIQAKSETQGWSVRINDNGKGISPEVLSRIGERGFSYGKNRVSGLGVFSAMEFVRGLGGEMGLDSRPGEGTSATIKFARLYPAAVLIDDDQELGKVWKKVADRKGIEFYFFANTELFFHSAGKIPLNAEIYLDVDFKDGSESGLTAGKKIASLGFREVFLATGHPRMNTDGLPWIAGVVGKEPPWLK